MQIKISKSEFQAGGGSLSFELEGEALGDTPSQHDLLDFVFDNGKVSAQVEAVDANHPRFKLSVTITEQEWQDELNRRKEEAGMSAPAQALEPEGDDPDDASDALGAPGPEPQPQAA